MSTSVAPELPEPPRRLRRSRSDAVIGGVAGGLGRYVAVDPLLFRIAFVVLTFAGGLGIVAYLAMLAFVPAEGEERAGDPMRTAARIVVAVLIAVATVVAAAGVALAAALGGGVVIAALVVLAGVALACTAFFGGARWLIVPAVALVLPLGLVAAADLDLRGGIGERSYHPASFADLPDRYELGIGELHVDLSDIELPPGRTDLRIELGMGEALLRVPENVCVTSEVAVAAGGVDVLDRENAGIDVAVSEPRMMSQGRPILHVDGDVGVGVLEVVRAGEMPNFIDRPGDWHPDRGRTFRDPGPRDTGCA
jgi:phage shock protein PspC (stress-responsive transcriptional regulator)/predicted membrane protein